MVDGSPTSRDLRVASTWFPDKSGFPDKPGSAFCFDMGFPRSRDLRSLGDKLASTLLIVHSSLFIDSQRGLKPILQTRD